MDKKKILLVAVSVGIFLVIAIGAAILIFSSRNSGINAMTTGRPIQPGNIDFGTAAAGNVPVYPVQPATMDPADMVRNEGIKGLQPYPVDLEAEENPYYSNSDIPGETSDRIVIDVPRPPVLTAPGAGAQQLSQGTRSQGEARPQTSPAANRNSNTAAPAKTASPAKPAQNTAPAQSKTYDTYWVQAGSFSAKNHADGVKETLAAKGITSIIENRDVEGRTFYRVRIGPYTSRSEADYWLALVQTLNGFEESQVWKSQAVR